MATITIRNLPEDVVRRLKARAKRTGRSMEQEVRSMLAQVVPDREEAMRRIEALRKRFLRQRSPGEVQEWRERHDGGADASSGYERRLPPLRG